MRPILFSASLALLLMASLAGAPAQAKGCIKGAVVGGVAGHYAGHHGLMGAAAGCVVSHHMASKQARERAHQSQISGGRNPSDDSAVQK